MIRNIIKKILPSSLVHSIRIWKYKRSQNKSKFKDKDISDTFSEIYRSNHWSGTESASGTGSDMEQTRVVRKRLSELLSKYNFGKMVDAPCGDFHWMIHTDLQGTEYLGGDIVPEMIEQNRQLYGDKGYTFMVLDLTKDEIPEADVLFCRDCLVHLDYASISKFIQNLKSSKVKYLLTTSFPAHTKNYNIVTGDWRPLNLQLAPFNWPQPKDSFLEECTEGDGIYADKSMMLWDVESIPVLTDK